MRLPPRIWLATLLAAALATGSGLPASATTAERAPHRPPVIVVRGAVDTPTTITLGDLATLPQTTLIDQRPGTRGHELTGVLLQTLIDQANPQLPTGAKNGALRVTATVSGRHGRAVAVARGELDPNFGNHPALLVLSRDGSPLRHAPKLAFPTDTDDRRSVEAVDDVRVAVAATASDLPAAGDLVVASGHRTITLSAARLAALPRRTITVTFLASGASQTHTETGPTLAEVLGAARIRVTAATTVAATASDGYVASATPGEATSGGRTLLVSLIEDGLPLTRPRLVTAGDVRGGRYVSDLTTLTVTASRCR